MSEGLETAVKTAIAFDWRDITVVVVYLVGIVGLGCWAGMRRRDHEGDAYFLGGKSLTWPVIGAALFASNISTVHMVSLAECGYKSGMLYGNFEWMAPFTLICLSLFFAPFYIRSGVATLPDFLEKRFNRTCRDWLAIMSLVAAVVIHIGFALYTGACVLHGVFGIDRNVCILVVAGLAGLYTIVGGLLAVMVTESIQTIILLIGAAAITLISLSKIGGWGGLEASVHPVNLSIIRPGSDPTGLSMWAVFLGYPVIGLWYWCCDQVIVQRVLAAKDENHARMGPLFTGFIKILPMFIFVVPGLICLGLRNNKTFTTPLESPSDTLTYLINNTLPSGLKGVMAAALLAAMMGSVSAALNSIATVFSYDIVKRWRPDTSERGLVLSGRIVTAVGMVAAILWSPLIGRFGTIFQGLNDLICYMAPPVTAVFLLGVFWRRTSSAAAVITLLSGAVFGLVMLVVQLYLPQLIGAANWLLGTHWPAVAWTVHSMLTGFVLFLIATATLIAFSYLYPHRHTAESEALVWKSLWAPLQGKAWRGLGSFRVVSATLFVVMVFLYWMFAGGENYYPIALELRLPDGTPVRGAKVTLSTRDPRLCNDLRFNPTVYSDQDGKCGFGTASLAGGAPAGTTYRVAIEPSQSTRVPLTAQQLADELKSLPEGATIVKSREGATGVKSREGATGGPTSSVGHRWRVPSDGREFHLDEKGCTLVLPPTAIARRYADPATSRIAFTVQPEQNTLVWELAPTDAEAAQSELAVR
jgi:SSS family solute:Na+ symporter